MHGLVMNLLVEAKARPELEMFSFLWSRSDRVA